MNMEEYNSIYEEEQDLDELEEMSNIITKYTGLSHTIWIIHKTNKEKHKLPRLKVKLPDGNRVPISIEDEPKVLPKNLKNIKFKKDNLIK